MTDDRKGGSVRMVLLFAAAVTACVMLGVPLTDGRLAIAQGGQEAVNPNASVLSNGAAVTPDAYAEAMDDEPFEGTGEVGAEFEATESARDVWALWNLPAMKAPVGTESIIGADGRVRVNPTTTSIAARATALVTFTGGRCTGWLYGSNIVATAGHCVHSGRGGTWRRTVRVYPGRNGSLSPYGYCTAKWLATVVGWASNSNEQYDYGAIKLNCTVGNRTGWFGRTTSVALNNVITTNGYPGDKPLTQWRSADIVRALTARQVFYRADTVGGQSGSAVYKAGPYAVAIHAYGLHGVAPHSTNNHGTRLISSVQTNLTTWKNTP